jgi:hypothetical protein
VKLDWPDMRGSDILVRTISKPLPKGSRRIPWQYNSRSDHHSKVACWGIVFDLLNHCPLLVQHVADRKVGFGINHEMFDFRNNRDKDLDLVVCTPGEGKRYKKLTNLGDMAEDLQLELSDADSNALRSLPELPIVPVGSVLIALEAKACMTEHVKAIPRLHDELNSSHLIIHGSTDEAIAAGFAMVNIADRFISPGRNLKPFVKPIVWNRHKQPDAAAAVINMISDIARRSKSGDVGYDAMAIVVVDCLNDDVSPVRLVSDPPAPRPNTTFHYGNLIERLSHLYATRFKYR